MKANEIPEKLYISYMGYGCFNDDGSIMRTNESQTEYTRTDAFIKKACKWFRDIDYDDSMPPFETTEEFIKVFKDYMKG